MTLAQFTCGFWTLWGLIDRRAIDRFRPVLIAMELSLLLVGCLFWLNVRWSADSFSPETWGDWACMLPAEFWAGAMILSGALIVSGLMHPITRGRIIIGSILHVLQFMGLAVSVLGSGGQFVIAVFSIVVFVPMHLVLAWEAAIYEPNGSA